MPEVTNTPTPSLVGLYNLKCNVGPCIQDIRKDNVNSPKHYTSHPSGIECIQITRHMNFNIGNVFKYLWRAGLKDTPTLKDTSPTLEDLKKAKWYLEDEIKQLEEKYAKQT